MPRRDVHIEDANATYLLRRVCIDLPLQLQKSNFNGGQFLAETFMGLLGCTIGAVAPDELEPAIHPNHRSTFHSVEALFGNLYGIVGAYNTSAHPMWQSFQSGFHTGYAHHLMADAMTPKGIPSALLS